MPILGPRKHPHPQNGRFRPTLTRALCRMRDVSLLLSHGTLEGSFKRIIYFQKFNIETPKQFCRHCLQNWIGQIHFPHFVQIAHTKPIAVSDCRVLSPKAAYGFRMQLPPNRHPFPKSIKSMESLKGIRVSPLTRS